MSAAELAYLDHGAVYRPRPIRRFRRTRADIDVIRDAIVAARFGQHESVELDAIAPTDLRALVREVIEEHLPEGALDAVRVAEASEREILGRIAATIRSEEAGR